MSGDDCVLGRREISLSKRLCRYPFIRCLTPNDASDVTMPLRFDAFSSGLFFGFTASGVLLAGVGSVLAQATTGECDLGLLEILRMPGWTSPPDLSHTASIVVIGWPMSTAT